MQAATFKQYCNDIDTLYEVMGAQARNENYLINVAYIEVERFLPGEPTERVRRFQMTFQSLQSNPDITKIEQAYRKAQQYMTR